MGTPEKKKSREMSSQMDRSTEQPSATGPHPPQYYDSRQPAYHHAYSPASSEPNPQQPFSQYGYPPTGPYPAQQSGVPYPHPGYPLSTHPGFPPSTHPGFPPSTQPGFPPNTHPGFPPSTHRGSPPSTQPGPSQLRVDYPQYTQLSYPQYSQPPYASPPPYQQVVYVQNIPKNAQALPMFTTNSRSQSKTDVGNDEEYHQDWSGFSEKEVRKTFIRRVYSILMIQLLFTLGVILLFILEPHVRDFVRHNAILYYISLGVFFVVYIAMACSGNLRRKYPTNIILLAVFTVAVSFMMGCISSYFKVESVAMAVGICAAVCFAVTLFSFYTKFDFTSCGGILCILLIILLIFGIVTIFVRSKLMMMIYGGLGAIIFTMYLAYDTQLMMEGKHVQLSPEEYIFAAIHIYIDIVYIFVFILMLIGGSSNN